MGNTTGAEYEGQVISARVIIRGKDRKVKTSGVATGSIKPDGYCLVDLGEFPPLESGETMTIAWPMDTEPKIIEGGASMSGEGGFRG